MNGGCMTAGVDKMRAEFEAWWTANMNTQEMDLQAARRQHGSAAQAVDKDAMTRLRRVMGLLGIIDPSPNDDEKLHEHLFAMLGQIAYQIERKAAPAEQAAVPEGLGKAILAGLPHHMSKEERIAIKDRIINALAAPAAVPQGVEAQKGGAAYEPPGPHEPGITF